ncbi:MAG: PhzF family phenazine biosynthesis protein [Alphaproteobacteria bacterium]|nr:PhzF family phenazine biosynthesis protein [Alphaproteobacteria bacterium]
MLSNHKLWLVDAFTGVPFKGNPAGVCVLDRFPDAKVMQKIAAELNWSETTFVRQKSEHHFHIRWFSPRDEAPLCGHATLAAAHILWEQQKTKCDLITFESMGGPLTAQKKGEWITLNFPAREVSACPMPEFLTDALGDVVIESVYKDDILYLVVLRDVESVVNLEPNLSLIEKIPCRAVIVTALGEKPYDFVSRYFAPSVGIPEDPVCGSAHCRLAPFWYKSLEKNEFLAYQASKRGGVLRVGFQGERVTLSGQAVTICEGIFLKPFERMRG